MNAFEEGFLMGVLAGEGHFGGDRFRPHIILHMRVRHQKLLEWVQRMIPASKLYGPYLHDGRHCMQWMARGRALRQELLPLLLKNYQFFDDHIRYRISRMINKYQLCEPGTIPLPPID